LHIGNPAIDLQTFEYSSIGPVEGFGVARFFRHFVFFKTDQKQNKTLQIKNQQRIKLL